MQMDKAVRVSSSGKHRLHAARLANDGRHAKNYDALYKARKEVVVAAINRDNPSSLSHHEALGTRAASAAFPTPVCFVTRLDDMPTVASFNASGAYSHDGARPADMGRRA